MESSALGWGGGIHCIQHVGDPPIFRQTVSTAAGDISDISDISDFLASTKSKTAILWKSQQIHNRPNRWVSS